MGIYVIAEAGMNHDGSLGNAIRMVEVAAEAGADAVKFQLHDAAAESTRDAPSPPYFQHESRWEYFQRTAFTDDQWRMLREACDRAGIDFVCAPVALEPHELEELVDGIREISEILASPVDKDAEAAALSEMKEIFEKSAVATRAIPAGSVIEREMLAAKKPGTGIPARRIDELVGMR